VEQKVKEIDEAVNMINIIYDDPKPVLKKLKDLYAIRDSLAKDGIDITPFGLEIKVI